MNTAAGTYSAATDWLGSLTGLVNSSGSQVTSTTYSPYGIPSATGTPSSSIGYAGSYTIPGAGGLDDMRARVYSPSAGSFASVDPLLPLTAQPYTYASESPVATTDPSGLIGGGWCFSAIFSFGLSAGGSACYVVTFDWSTGEVQMGRTFTLGGGLGYPSVGLGYGPMISNANSLSDLGGWFGQLGGSLELGGGSLGGDFFTGLGSCNQQIYGAGGTLGISADLPLVLAGGEGHGLFTYTWQSSYASFNLYNVAENVGWALGKWIGSIMGGW